MADLQHAQHSDVHDVIDALDRVQPDDGAVFLDGYHDKVADEIYGLALYGVGNGPPDFPAAVLMANARVSSFRSQDDPPVKLTS